jgi:hypothetical protein
MEQKQIADNLLAGFKNPSGEEQEQAVLKAIKEIGNNANDKGMFSEFMINLRDYLLNNLY